MAKLITKKKKSSDEPDELLSLGQQLWVRVNDKPREAIAVFGGLVGVLLLVLLGLFIRDRAEARRNTKVASVMERLHEEKGVARADLLPELEEISRKYSRFLAGAEALYYLGSLHSEAGDYERAEEAYSRIRSEYAEHETYATAATLGLAYTHLLKGEDREALGLFGELLKGGGGTFPRSQVLLETAGINERLGDREKAREAYREIVSSYPDTPFERTATERLTALEGA